MRKRELVQHNRSVLGASDHQPLAQRNIDPRGFEFPSRYLRYKSGTGAGGIQGRLRALRTASGGLDAPYVGLKIGSVEIFGAPCGKTDLIGTTVDVVDHSECVFDRDFTDLEDVWVWASQQVFASLDGGEGADPFTPCHWAADDRCCVVADGTGTTTATTELYIGSTPPTDTSLIWIDTSEV